MSDPDSQTEKPAEAGATEPAATPHRRPAPKGASLWGRRLAMLALSVVLGFGTFRLFAPSRNVVEEVFHQRVAPQVQEGKAALLVFGDPKT